MANTTNFGWETPDDTDLVKDGAAAIRTLGSAIDTSLVDLKGGTTGQVLAKNSNTDMDFVWTAGGDITEVSAGTGISGGGTSGSVTITNSMATAIDAKGDLIAGTGADTFSRLAVGANDTVLTADSTTATGLKWATAASGGWTQLATGSLTGSTIEMTSINNGYRNLVLIVTGFRPATDDKALSMDFGASSGNYDLRASTNSATNVTYGSSYLNLGYNSDSGAPANNNFHYVQIYNYASSVNKIVTINAVTRNAADTGFNVFNGIGNWDGTSAVSTIRIYPETGNFTSGTYYLYGVK